MPPNMQPLTAAHVKIFAFMLPLNRETQGVCKLCLVRLLGKCFVGSRSGPPVTGKCRNGAFNSYSLGWHWTIAMPLAKS
jgi:hypothetical protein